MLVTVMLKEPAEPWARVRIVGLILILKFGPTVDVMVRRRTAVWIRLPLVPVTLIE